MSLFIFLCDFCCCCSMFWFLYPLWSTIGLWLNVGVLDFCQILFLHSLGWLCSFCFLCCWWVYCIDWLAGVRLTLHSWYKLYFSWCIILSVCCWTWLHWIVLRTFVCLFIRNVGLFFPWDVFVWYWYQDNTGLVERVENYSLLVYFYQRVYKKLVFMLKCAVELTSKATWDWVLLCHGF